MSQSLTAGSQPPPPQDSRPVKEQPYHERTHEHNWRHGHYLPDYLTGDERVDIQVSFVLGGVHRIDGGLRVYMVLKFFYGAFLFLFSFKVVVRIILNLIA